MTEVTITAEQARAWEKTQDDADDLSQSRDIPRLDHRRDVGYVLVSRKELGELKAELEQLSFVTEKEVKVIDGWLLRK